MPEEANYEDRETRFTRKEINGKIVGTSSVNLSHAGGRRMFKKLNKHKDIRRDLEEVYTDGNGEIPDMTKLDKERRPFWRTFFYTLTTAMVLLAIAIGGGWLVYNNLNGEDFSNERVALKIETPVTAVSGQEATYTVIITNKEKVNLYNVKLELSYPENFEFIDADPKANGEKNNNWEFSLLKVGETQKVEIKGKAIAPLDSNLTFQAALIYKPANMNADFKQEATVDVKVASSMINLNVTGPEKVLANQEVEYELSYQNLSEETWKGLELVIDYPEGFVPSATEPEAKEGNNNLWEIKELLPQGEGKVKVKGNYSAVTDGGNKEFKARIQMKKDDQFLKQAEQTVVTTIVKDQLSMQLIVNGSAEDQTIGFGDLLVYSLNYKNTGQEDLKNIKITVHLDSQILDWGTLKDENGGKVGSDTITWTGKEISKLLKLGSDEEGIISWQIKVKDSSVASDEGVGKLSVESFAEAQIEQADSGQQSTSKSKTLVNSINSDLSLEAQARYYDEDNIPLGMGPIKPKAGEKSSYNIQLKLANNLHNVENVKVVATLPKNVKWESKENHNTGDLVYDSGTNKVTWYISRLSKSAKNTSADFNVSIIPQEADLGRILILVSEINLAAKDADTGSDIGKQQKAITTAFNDPILGQLNGIVE